jgi:VanZ family protein
MYLSLANSHAFDKVPEFKIPFLDKIVHSIMYFTLMSAILFENRKSLRGTSHLFLIALLPLFYGILMEVLQFSLTETRSGNIYDVFANSSGILISILIWPWCNNLIKKIFRY